MKTILEMSKPIYILSGYTEVITYRLTLSTEEGKPRIAITSVDIFGKKRIVEAGTGINGDYYSLFWSRGLGYMPSNIEYRSRLDFEEITGEMGTLVLPGSECRVNVKINKSGWLCIADNNFDTESKYDGNICILTFLSSS